MAAVPLPLKHLECAVGASSFDFDSIDSRVFLEAAFLRLHCNSFPSKPQSVHSLYFKLMELNVMGVEGAAHKRGALMRSVSGAD